MESYKVQSARFKAEQQKFWTALKEKLEGFKDNCGASMAEMADGLDISRQPLYNFMDDPTSGLSKINRQSLLSLWAYLTDPEQYQHRKLTRESRDARKSLYQEGPDDLLRAAGFLGRDDLDKRAMTITDPQMKRLVLRLQSKWLYDDALRAYIIDGFLDDLLDQGRPERNSYLEPLNYEKLDEKQKIEEWPFTKRLQDREKYRESSVRNSYQNAIKNLVSSGKTEFVEAELFELYQSIIEHRENRNSDNEVKIYRCEFETLSSKSILDRLNFLEIQVKAERRVSFSPEIITSNSQFPPIVEVKIGCQFVIDDNQGLLKESYFKYASTATHVENMLVAIKQGLCHPLDISGFFIRAVGRTDKSLARVAIALSESSAARTKNSQGEKVEKVYQGWWVTSNTILGILKSFVDAFKRWLSENNIQNHEYYKACQKLADVNEKFYEINTAVFEGNFDISHDHNDVERKIDEAVRLIRGVENEDLFKSIEEVRLRLKGKEFRIALTLLHLNIYKGRIEKAKEIVDSYQKPKDIINQGVNSLDKPFKDLLITSAHIEYMKYKLVTGDEEFLVGKRWRFDEKYSLDKFENVARKYAKRSGNINFNCYSFMAESFGALGLMEFYSIENKREHLEKGCEHLIESAHYSSRIGYERKATQSLLYVVRYLSRFGSDDANQTGQRILDESEAMINRKQSTQDKDWLNAIYHLSYGEKYLLVDNLPDKAMVEFLSAFRCSLDINYMRLVPDCLYNIFRACDKILNSSNEETIKGNIKKIIDDKKIGHEFPFLCSDEIYSSILNESTMLIEEYLRKEINEWKLEETRTVCRDTAISLWNRWANVEGYDEHPFSEYIRKGSFLSPLDKS